MKAVQKNVGNDNGILESSNEEVDAEQEAVDEKEGNK